MLKHIIKVKEVEKIFATEQALKSVSFEVEKGEIFGFLGPSGSGKTTTIKILTGQLQATSGHVEIFGRHVKVLKQPNWRQKFDILTDNSGLYERLSIEDNLKLYQKLYRCSENKIQEVLDIVQLQTESKKRVSELSKGMKQRVVLARALLHEPELLFLDEPTSALDPVNTIHIYRGLRALNEKGTTIFLTTHDMHEAETLCDRVAILHEGEIKLLDRPKALKQNYAQNKLKVELTSGEILTIDKGTAGAERMFQYMQNNEIVTVHSDEPSLGDIFVNLTGRELV